MVEVPPNCILTTSQMAMAEQLFSKRSIRSFLMLLSIKCEQLYPCAYRLDMLPYLACVGQLFHAQAQLSAARLSPTGFPLPGGTEFYDVKHHSFFHSVCPPGSNQQLCF